MSGHALRSVVLPRLDGMMSPADPSNPNWTYGVLNQLRGDYRADPGMVVTPPNSPLMPQVPDYNLNQHLPTQGVIPASAGPSINPMTGLPEFNLAANVGSSMSQTMMPPGGMPGGGGGGAPPQLPPQVLQMLMQRMQGGGGPAGMPPGPGGGGPPGMPSPGMAPPMPQGGAAPPGMPSGGAPGPMQGAPPPIPQPGQAAQLAQQGRFGDSVMAHLTPGEVEIPPQVQTPQLMAAIRAAFARFGINPAQFTAGAPQASHNPNTGAPEFSLWASLLPILGAIGGGIVGGLPTMGIGAPAGAAIGGGLGGAAGGLADHQTGLGIALSGLGGAAGGYVGGGGLGGLAGDAAGGAASGLANTSTDAAASALGTETGAVAGAAGTAPGLLGGAIPSVNTGAAANPFGSGSLSDIIKLAKPGLYASTGAGLGAMLAPAPRADLLAAAGFNKPLPPLNPNFNQLRGAGTVSTPQFQNYNPYSAVTGPSPGYNFFPGGG